MVNLLISPCAESKKKEFAAQSPLWMSDELEFWPERGEPLPQFSLLAALYSELIAVTSGGQLYQWKWNEAEPYRHSEVCRHYSSKLKSGGKIHDVETLYRVWQANFLFYMGIFI
jgi:hypothetical protein